MNLGFALSLVSEWELAGVTDAVISPGSRSSPIAVALARSMSITSRVVLDERSAGFIALGLSKVSQIPTIVLTTSGTAATNLRPSITEAFHSGVPLLVVTADRPLELHQVGAPQTIEQEHLFSDVVRFSVSPSVPDTENSATWRSLAARAFHEANSNPLGKGPVHLNLAFREPLLELSGEPTPPRSSGRPWYQVHLDSNTKLRSDLLAAERVLVVAGWTGQGDREAQLQKFARLGWPVIADPRSGFRRSGGSALGGFEAFLRSSEVRSQILPQVIVLLGEDLSSRNLNDFIFQAAGSGSRIIRVSSRWFWQDPMRVVSDFYFGSLESFLVGLVESAESRKYLESLLTIDQAAQKATLEALGVEMTEPLASIELYRLAGSDDLLFVSSSMPIRDLEWFAPMVDYPPQVYANRGVNGIDGVISSFVGAASAHKRSYPSGKSYLLVGDLAFQHDVGCLANLSRTGLDLFICVLDNNGGGIFSFLPQATILDDDLFEELFGTPQGIELAAISRGFGLYTHAVEDLSALHGELKKFKDYGGIRVILIRSDRGRNVLAHRVALERGTQAAVKVLSGKF